MQKIISMLKSIYIKNFAIIEEVELEFSSGLNILTGETGAGKSIIVDAISIAFGERASSDLIRNGANKSIVECIFDLSNTKDKVDLSSFDEYLDGNELIIRREIPIKGNSRSFINDTPVPTSKLRELSDLLIDFLGQHEHQTLLYSSKQLRILDNFAENHSLISEYQQVLTELTELIYHLKEYNSKKDSLFDKKDDIIAKINLLNRVNPSPNEDEEINAKLKKIENAEFLSSLANELYNVVFDGDFSCYQQLHRAKKIIDNLSKYDDKFNEYDAEINSIAISLKEFSVFVKSFLDSIDFNPLEIEQLRERYSELKKIIRQFGSLENAIDARQSLRQELELIDKFDEKIAEIKDKIVEKSRQLGNIAQKIDTRRKEKSIKLSSEIVEKLKNLGIEKAQFEVSFTQSPTNGFEEIFEQPCAIIEDNFYKTFSNGISHCEFLISTNPGFSVQPLKNVASGGEISRIMLAIKSIIAKADNIPLLIFDEIDTGISGKIAQKVAQEMKELSKFHQIIAITHLPQVAAAGDRNFIVEKIPLLDDTIVRSKALNAEEKVKEIAKMLSGEKISEYAIKNARELIKSVAYE